MRMVLTADNALNHHVPQGVVWSPSHAEAVGII
jgi:hypothetical protein